MKFLKAILLCLTISAILAVDMQASEKNTLQAESSTVLTDMASCTPVTKTKVPGEPTNVVAKAWMKYFVFYPTSKNGKTPKAFYINPSYALQFSENQEVDSELHDQFGSIEVPDEYHFFMELTYDAMYIVTARRNDLIKTVDSIQIDSLAVQQNWSSL